MKRFVTFTAIMLFSVGMASAGPIVSKDIGTGAKWFGHVNCEAIRSLKLVQDMKDKCPVHKQCQAKMARIRQEVGDESDGGRAGSHALFDRYGGKIGSRTGLREETQP